MKITFIKIGIAGLLLGGFIQIVGCSGGQDSAKKAAVAEEPVTIATNAAGQSLGIGPVESVVLGELDAELVTVGKTIFEEKCVACHNIDARLVGPALKDVTNRRSPEWIMNFILNPVEMAQKDPEAKKLLAEYQVQMVFQDLTEQDARAVFEYFRSIDGE